ncbi:DUF4298 domain-containing protein [Dolosigranulum pigrum]|uniref:DUF4298 domain-containing protein n=1 Tax=Dolosigranulum pigrum TaxID=29394 RepID=A0A516GK09_9LACT|nr:DUF4298 domain-containing protein [Dolosigranulum pigrum]QDO91835.1 DUF4298 domain-containing protein [Dolosigranulum pigrum]
MTLNEGEQQQLERIAHYEQLMAELAEDMEDLEELLKTLQETATALSEYYSSSNWMLDKDFSESERFPESRTSGVLSEDGLYNLLGDYYEAGVCLMEQGLRMIKLGREES